MKTSRKFELRSAEAVVAALFEMEPEVAIDLPSDDEEDAVEVLTDSDSEQEADDPQFLDSNDVASPKKRSDIEQSQEEDDAPAPKRARMREPTTETQQPSAQQWFPTPPETYQNHFDPPKPIITPGPIGEAKKIVSPLEAWNLIFDEASLQRILSSTNEEMKNYRESIDTEDNHHHPYKVLDMPELKAFLGLMYFTGLQKSGQTNIDDLWSHEYGSQIYRAAMPLNRFKIIFKMLRFDDKSTRNERKKTDKFAAIREIWKIFISNCAKYYNPDSNCTVGEQILSFNGRCPFKIRKNNKPNDLGLKIVMLNDAKTFYMYSAEPYVDKVVTEEIKNPSFYYINKLSENLRGTKRNLICNNGFSSVEMFDEMLRDRSTTMIGTVRKNDSKIPANFKYAGNVGTTKFVFSETQTLASYTTNKNKIVLLITTLKMNESEILELYNSAKSATKNFGNICYEFTTTRKTLRWSMRIFMGMLDYGGINSMILYNFNGANVKFRRKDFFKSLVRGLIEPQLRKRLDSTFLRRDLRFSIQNILRMELEFRDAPAVGFRRSRCFFCPRAMDKKVRVYCDQCNRPVCDEHRSTFCNICSSTD